MINLSRSYLMTYSFLICCFYFIYRDDLANCCRLSKRFKELGLLLKAEITSVPVVVVARYALYPTCLIPRDKHCYILRVKSGLLADFAIPFSLRTH